MKDSVSKMGKECWREKSVGFLMSNGYRCLEAIRGTLEKCSRYGKWARLLRLEKSI